MFSSPLSRFLPKFLRTGKGRAAEKSQKDSPYPTDKNKENHCKVRLLDDTEITFDSKPNCKGQVLLNKVFDYLNLIERDYFGLRFLDHTGQAHWLDTTKSLNQQIKSPPYYLYFGVKFYAADPCKLHEEITRYQFFLQVKRDILQGRLPINFDIAAELCAYAVQSELGDYDPHRHTECYVSELRFAPNQTEELEEQISQIHKALAGQVPAVAEYRYLDKVKWLDMYGVDLHPVLGEGSIEYFLGLTPSGVVVYKNKQKVGNYFWPRITKVNFKGKIFHLKVRDKNNDENPYAFELATKESCKHLWKCCVEHHAFFRLSQNSDTLGRNSGKMFNLGSKYRYSGRTEKQVLTDRANRQQPVVLRTPSQRQTRRVSSESKLDKIGLSDSSRIMFDSSRPMSTMVLSPEYNTSTMNDSPMRQPNDSPRSTRSVPWERNHQSKGGLYTSGRDSPLSVRSEKLMFPRRVPSESESEAPKRKHHHSRRDANNENDPHGRRNRRRKSRGGDSGSESEAAHRHRRHHRHRSAGPEVGGGKENWQDEQNRINDSDHRGMTGSDASHKKHRRRSKSPRSNKKPPEELRQHFEYELKDTEGMTEEQLRDIPFVQVETKSEPFRPRYQSPHRYRHKSPAAAKKINGEPADDDGPPAYQPPDPWQDYEAKEKEKRQLYQQQQQQQQQLQQQQQQQQQQQRHQQQPRQPSSQNNWTPNSYRSSASAGDQEKVRPSPSVYKQEALTAPIVKTKPSANYGGHMKTQNSPNPNNNYSGGVERVHTPEQNHHQSGFKVVNHHSREDSGLGNDQEMYSANHNGSLNHHNNGPSTMTPRGPATVTHNNRWRSDPVPNAIQRPMVPPSSGSSMFGTTGLYPRSQAPSMSRQGPLPTYRVVSKPTYVEQISSHASSPQTSTPPDLINHHTPTKHHALSQPSHGSLNQDYLHHMAPPSPAGLNRNMCTEL